MLIIQNSLHNKNFEYRVCVDTSPLMEKHWGQKAGLGWIGKHTNLINSKIGTWFFLSEIIIDFELEFNKPYTYDLCGSCTKCIDACPTEALKDYVKALGIDHEAVAGPGLGTVILNYKFKSSSVPES